MGSTFPPHYVVQSPQLIDLTHYSLFGQAPVLGQGVQESHELTNHALAGLHHPSSLTQALVLGSYY